FLLGGDGGRIRLARFRRSGQLVAFAGDALDLVHVRTRTGRDQATDDDVLLEAVQRIDLAADGGFGEDAGRFLEGSGRDKGTCLQRSLRDTLQNRDRLGGDTALLHRAGVLVVDVQTVDLFARQEGRVAGFGDFDFLHHLADNHFDVLVVQLHALQTIDVLNLVDEIVGQGLNAQDRQDLMRDRGAINQDVAFLDQIAFLNDNVLAFRDQVF